MALLNKEMLREVIKEMKKRKKPFKKRPFNMVRAEEVGKPEGEQRHTFV